MSKIFFSVIIMFIVAIIIVVASLIAYNKRLEKVASGELRDTHSKIPEPGMTAGITYKTVLIALVIISVLSISSTAGVIRTLSSNVTNLQSKLHTISMDVMKLQDEVSRINSLLTDFSWELTGHDMVKKTATIKFSLGLKEYSKNTKVAIALKSFDADLTMTGHGTFTGEITTNLFEFYDQLKICITEGEVTKVESVDFYEYLFWDVLPMHGLECEFASKDAPGSAKCSGWYRLAFNNTEKIKKVNVRYVVDGKEVKSFDATAQAKENVQITLDKEYTYESAVSLIIETDTVDGYRIETRTIIAYRAPIANEDDDYERIYDEAGNLVWENEKYN